MIFVFNFDQLKEFNQYISSIRKSLKTASWVKSEDQGAHKIEISLPLH